MSLDRKTASERLQRLFLAKARAELEAADALLGTEVTVAGHGDPLGEVVLVKGLPDAQDREAGVAMARADGEAAAKILDALGLDPGSAWIVCSRPGADVPREARSRRLAMVVEAVDPRLVIAVDAEASDDLACALGVSALQPGRPTTVRGRVVGAVGGLAASLGDPSAKASVWEQFKAIAVAATGA